MRTAVLIAAILSAVSAGDLLAQAPLSCRLKTCSGGTPVLHNDNGYWFETSSTVYPANGTGRFVYQTCVENKSDRDFEVNWYLPGPAGWVPKGCAVTSPRQKIKQETVDGYRSCLRYGNAWHPDRAEFVPHRSDLQAINDEKQKDCGQVIAEEPRQRTSNATNGNVVVELADLRTPVSEELETFAPLDPKEPEATMVRIVAHVLVEPSENLKTFKHTVRWDVAKAYPRGPEYRANLSVSPENADIREVYQKNFGTGPGARVPVNPEKPIIVEFAMPAHPDLGTVRYRLLSANGMPVASIFVPMWLGSQ
jgi:hypothetical protein